MGKFRRTIYYCPTCGNIWVTAVGAGKFCSEDGTRIKKQKIEYGE